MPTRTPPDRPGRRARRRAETRERIFRAALKLFAERGFPAATVEAITEAADVGKGTFFNYFPSKEHVLGAFGALQAGKVEAALGAAKGGEASAAEVLRQLPRELALEPGRSPGLVRSLMVAVHSNDAVRALMLANQKRARKSLAALVRLAQEQGDVRRDLQPQFLARCLMTTYFGGLFLWALGPTGALADRLEAAMQLYWEAAQTSPARIHRRQK
jgi:AcrR family transcriptional regulator